MIDDRQEIIDNRCKMIDFGHPTFDFMTFDLIT